MEGKEYITRSKYDYFGKVIEIVYPNGQLVNYGYNSAGQLIKVGTSLNPEAYVKSINYTATGKRQKIVYGNGVETSYEYDPVRDAIKQIKTTKAGGEVLQDLTYSFDKVGNITGLANGADLGTTAYQYDSLDRLVVATASGFTNSAMNYSRTIGFADNGNITGKSDVGSYGWSTSVNQLLTVANRSMVWDEVGNLSSRTILTNSESHLQKFSYDVHNNLTFFTNAHEFDGGGNWVKYSYDYSGQRLKRWSYSGNETIYPNKFYSIKNSKWTNNHIYAGKERICTLVNGEPSFIHRDQINSGGLITTNSGQVGDKITFAPYGEILYQQNTNSTLEEGFTGQILDPETGLYYYNARYYDPKIGIFISADTIVPDPYSSQDFNRYSYVKGNPIKYSDPTGHSAWIYYDAEFAKQAKVEAELMKKQFGKDNVKMREVKDMRTDFVPSWNKEAAKDKNFMGSSWLFHGNKRRIWTEKTGIITKIGMNIMKYFSASKMKKYDILSKLKVPIGKVGFPMIKLMTCNGGRLTKGENIAEALVKRFGMSVWAMDGSLSYSTGLLLNTYWPHLYRWHGFLNAAGLGNYSGPNIFYNHNGLILNYPSAW